MTDTNQYIGRFAPSPTGLLHLGSLMAAMASYCDAMKNNGQWHLRIEDIDPPREVAGASEKIIHTLKNLGFKCHSEVIFQSQQIRQNAYQKALDRLIHNGHTYNCCCSRKELQNTSIFHHKCRTKTPSSPPNKPFNIRLKVPNKIITFMDKIQGKYQKNTAAELGDFVLKRKDGLFSYQLAVVVDDNYQQINTIVRGIDLIDSTPWQIVLNSLLGFSQQNYAHIPILVNNDGQKLSKQTYAQEINAENPLEILMTAYSYLKQKALPIVPQSSTEFWQMAIKNWDITLLQGFKEIKLY